MIPSLRVRLLFAWLLGSGAVLISQRPAQTADPTPAEIAAVKQAEAARMAAIDRVYGSVVAIYGNDRGGGGSGVLYDPAGFALTNHHVVAAAGVEGWAGLADGRLYRWRIVGTDPGGDVAIIQLLPRVRPSGDSRPPFPTAPIADSNTVQVGDWAMAMGNPFVLAEDQRPTVTLGVVSGVHRFQEGQGMNQLVYGDCIQVDSSINPGNSGGPLFNLRGEVIGVNGRGSFEERGRVNVGLGYAISANQLKYFIPELLATKLAQHGTLDAVFGDRDDGVVCHTINLDSPLARKGMQLGDELLEFEGHPIRTANEFNNLVTIYPAGWPAKVVFRREQEKFTAVVRLTPLPYEPIVKQPAEEKPDDEKPDNKKPGDEEPCDVQPAPKKPEPPRPPPEEGPPAPVPGKAPVPKGKARPNFGEAGKIRDKKQNVENARELLFDWLPMIPARSNPLETQLLTVTSRLLKNDEVVGQQRTQLSPSGAVRCETTLAGKQALTVFDRVKFHQQTPERPWQEVSAAKAFRNPYFSQSMVLALLFNRCDSGKLGELSLDGSDKAAGGLCYRLSLTSADSESFYLWLKAPSWQETRERLVLMKTAVGVDDDETAPALVYSHWKTLDRWSYPQRTTLVQSLAETPAGAIEIDAVEFSTGEVSLTP